MTLELILLKLSTETAWLWITAMRALLHMMSVPVPSNGRLWNSVIKCLQLPLLCFWSISRWRWKVTCSRSVYKRQRSFWWYQLNREKQTNNLESPSPALTEVSFSRASPDWVCGGHQHVRWTPASLQIKCQPSKHHLPSSLRLQTQG